MADTRHPLDPLSASEIEAAAGVVRAQAGLDASAWFETISLSEPDEAYVRAFQPGGALRRKAFVAAYEPNSNRTFDGVVDLAASRLERWDHVPGAQPRIVLDEFAAGERIAKADPAFQAALAKRGIFDLDQVLVEPWPAGNFAIPAEAGRRIWYPNQHPGGDGLPRWTEADRTLENENLVVWYTLNYHHLPRPEDWPVQPTAHAGFHWMPVGFFEANPALDVPPRMSGNGHAKEHCD